MKKLLILTIALMSAGVMSAKEPYTKGYRFSLEAQTGVSVDKSSINNTIGLNTVHGYSFGNGAFLGGGIGLDFKRGTCEGVYLPLFLDAKYNFGEYGALSPFAEMRMGVSVNVGGSFEYSDSGINAYSTGISPAVGVDFGSFTVKMGYLLSSLRLRSGAERLMERENYLYFGFGVNF